MLTLGDPNGMVIDLVASDGDHRSGWDGVADIGAEHAIRGLHAVTLSEHQLDPSAVMLTDLLGMSLTGEEGDRSRFGMGDEPTGGTVVDVSAGVRERGLQAGGTVHHVAFRAPDLATMTQWQHELQSEGVRVTDILDRQYFKSIYFREPGGVFFEIAVAGAQPGSDRGFAAAPAPRRRSCFGGAVTDGDGGSLARPHLFLPAEPGANGPPLLLLHGTGGTEHDLLPLREHLSPGAAVLSPRGTVLEHGMPRHFRRLREGVFDEADLTERAHELAEFVVSADEHYGIATGWLVAVGFSNDANIASALLLQRPDTLRGALLLAAMVPYAELPQADLDGTGVVVCKGARDPMISPAQTELLGASCGAWGRRPRRCRTRAGTRSTRGPCRPLRQC